MLKDIVFPMALLILAVVLISFALTGVWLSQVEADCIARGGTFTVEGSMAHCRF